MTRGLTLPLHVQRWCITDARVPACLLTVPVATPDRDGLVVVNLTIAGDRIETIAAAGAEAHSALPRFTQPGLLVPAFVDAHTHLDKGHTTPRAPNPTGSFIGARATVPLDREAHWTAEDVQARMEFALHAAYAYGTRAIRTHLDCVGTQTRISWPVFAAVRERWRDRIELKASPLYGIELAMDDAHMRDVTAMVDEFGDCLGAVTYPVPELQPGLDRLFRLAGDKGWALDFHADETHDPACNTLAAIAQTAIDQGFAQPILVGHCCSLAVMPDEERKRTIDLVARAGLSIVSLPMCNMYLQDRLDPGRTPRWRGVTAVKELRAAGVPVSIASDNTRDPFYAYGDLDMAEVWREGTRIAHLDHPYGEWARLVSAAPAEALGLDEPGLIRVGGPADFVMFEARTLSEFMARPLGGRTVVRHGRPIDAEPLPYRALDHLAGLKP